MFLKSLPSLTFHTRPRFKRFVPSWWKKKAVEDTTKDAPENDLEETTEETTTAITPQNHKHNGSQSGLNETTAETTAIASQNHKHNVSQSGLYILPAELLLEVVDYLPRTSVMALGVTCTRFYKTIASPKLQKNPTKETLFEVLAQLEISLGPWHSKPLCGRCLISHKDDFFWGSQLELGPVQRRCKSTQKLVWLNSTLDTSFEELKQIATEVRNIRRPVFSSSILDAGSIIYAGTDRKDNLLLDHSIDLLRFRYGKRPLLKTVFQFFEKFDIPICPHLATGDPMIADIYRKDVLQFAPDCLDGWHHNCPVRTCQTTIHFRVDHYREGPLCGEKLTLHMRRSINVHNGPEGQCWLSQAIITPDRARFKESCQASWSWKTINDEIDKGIFIAEYPSPIPYSSLLNIRRRTMQLTDERDGLDLHGNIRTLYQPLIPHPHVVAFIGMKNDIAIRMRDNFDDLI